jgi:glycine/D-amino acid oxidase-like deaminating enzyme
MEVDVCVVGSGIAGLTTAYMLMLEGKSVVVLDEGPIGAGETERATAHLTHALDDRYCRIERLHGEQGARLAAQSHTAAIGCIETIVTNEKIDCDFERVDGYLYVPPRESSGILERELAAAHRAGLIEVERVSRAPVDSFDTGPCLRFPRQAQFHLLKYLIGLAQVFQQHGGRIFAGTQVAKIEGGSLAKVRTEAGQTVVAEAVVVATNTLLNDRMPIHKRLAPYRTYVIGTRVPPGSAPRALYWDTAEPSHHVRVQSLPLGKWSEEAYDILNVSGEGHRAGPVEDAEAHWTRLEDWARQRFPLTYGIEYRWAGRVMEPIDGLAMIGRNPMDQPNVYIATADSGNGMTHGTIAGLLLRDLIFGRENEWAGLYDPGRFASSVPASSCS